MDVVGFVTGRCLSEICTFTGSNPIWRYPVQRRMTSAKINESRVRNGRKNRMRRTAESRSQSDGVNLRTNVASKTLSDGHHDFRGGDSSPLASLSKRAFERRR